MLGKRVEKKRGQDKDGVVETTGVSEGIV